MSASTRNRARSDRWWHPRRHDLARALEYPYARPAACYVFHSGAAHAVALSDPRERLRAGRTPVLAYGSNRSPLQLARKFGHLAESEAILVETCEVPGWDVVHSAHVTRYGAVPAALHAAPGTTVRVAVTWLDDRQLGIMDVSERAGRNYGRRELDTLSLLGDGAQSDRLQAYLTSHGPLRVRGRIAGHAAVEARGRRGPTLDTATVLRSAHARFAPGLPFPRFVLRLVDDPGFRDRVTERLKQGL